MDKKTLKALRKEANLYYKNAEKAFLKYDQTEDMNEADMWANVVGWLDSKLDKLEEADE
jgi:accessory colonization factor AcfC